jgi:LmbE family N-acetylglucosaminyl deacetylase
MKLLGFNKVLCLSPHPDDVEFSMSGTIAKFYSTEFDVYTISCGTATDISSSSKRLDEVKEFWNILNLKNLKLIFSSIAFFDDKSEAQWITKIENDLNFLKNYDAIFFTSDSDSHFEHLIVNRIAKALVRSQPISLIEYKSPSTLNTWQPNFFIDVNKEFPLKKNALITSFKSQSDSRYFSEQSLNIFHSDFSCFKKGVEILENFKIILLNGK